MCERLVQGLSALCPLIAWMVYNTSVPLKSRMSCNIRRMDGHLIWPRRSVDLHGLWKLQFKSRLQTGLGDYIARWWPTVLTKISPSSDCVDNNNIHVANNYMNN